MTKEKLVPTPADQELAESFLEYSMSVVYSRAIPSIDGLKPVQRRILFGMMDAGWTHDKNFVKVSRIAGEVMGKLHPHGDSSISDALVKLAQPFYINVPMIEGYGNFGDATGSPAAAARYIEARLSKAADFVLREIKEGTVDHKPNYDGEMEEPTLLPIMFPVLLVNGNFGIGVGFSNKMAPHNLREVIEGTKAMIRKPGITLDEMMKHIPGPDFPTGAQILGMDGVREAYETGQGVIRLRAKAQINPTSRGKHEIVFTELPYGVSTTNIIAKIKDLLKVGKLPGLADAKDLTDRKSGLRVVIDSKAGVNPQALLAELYKETQLEESFGINSTVLVNGEPKTVGLLEQIELFIAFRKEVVRRRSEFRKQKRLDRLHLVEGLLKALANIDEVIKIVRAAADAATAQDKLMRKFKVDEIQADYILGIPLRRLTKYDTIQLQDEQDRLRKEIAELDDILSNEDTLKKVILSELDEVKKVLGTDRKSELVGGNLAEIVAETKKVAASTTEVADEPCFVTLLASGAVVRSAEPHAAGGRGKLDPVLDSVATTTRSKIVFATNKGRGFRVEVIHLSEGKNNPKDAGVDLDRGERVVAVAPDVDKNDKSTYGLVMGTKQGIVKVFNMATAPTTLNEFPVIGLDAGDEVLAARYVKDAAGARFFFASSDASILASEVSKVRPQGGPAGGVAGFKLAADAQVLAFGVLLGEEAETGVFYTSTGASHKLSAASLIPTKGRGTGGVRGQKFLKGETVLETVFFGAGDVLAVDEAGKKVELPGLDPRRDGSGTKIAGAKPVVFGRKA